MSLDFKFFVNFEFRLDFLDIIVNYCDKDPIHSLSGSLQKNSLKPKFSEINKIIRFGFQESSLFRKQLFSKPIRFLDKNRIITYLNSEKIGFYKFPRIEFLSRSFLRPNYRKRYENQFLSLKILRNLYEYSLSI